jgi:hypothetical protein
MATLYEIWVGDDAGNRIALVDNFENLVWGRALGTTGSFALRFAADQFSRSLFGLNRRVEIWRQPEGGQMYVVTIGFMRYLEQGQEGANAYVIIGGPDALDLLNTRIVDAYSDTAGADKAGTADDVMKEYVYEALGGGAAAGRNLTSDGFSIQADLSDGPAIQWAAARHNLLRVCRELSDAAYEAGTPTYFDIVHPTPATFEFRTYVNQRGEDRTSGQPNAVVLSPEEETLANPVLIQDYTEEVTYCYALGQSTGGTRNVQEEYDSTRLNLALFNRREGTVDGRDYGTDAELQDLARRTLYLCRPRRDFRGDIVDKPGNRLGLNWNFGDRVTAQYAGEQYDMLVSAVGASFDENGETIDSRLDYLA